MTLTIELGWRQLGRSLLVLILLTGWALGVLVGYHFYLAPTGVSANGHRLNRVQLIDWAISQQLKK